MKSAATNRRAYRAAVIAFAVAAVGGIAAAVGYWTENTGDLLGLGLAAGPRSASGSVWCAGRSTSTSTSTWCRQREPLTVDAAAAGGAARRDRHGEGDRRAAPAAHRAVRRHRSSRW